MNINLTLIGQLFSFALFVLFCSKYVWPPVIKNLEERKEKISKGLRDAERAKKELQESRINSDDIVTTARKDASKIIEKANLQANQIIEEAKASAVDQSEKIKQQAIDNINQERLKAQKELQSKLASTSILIAEKILKREIKQADHQELINEVKIA